MRARLVALLVCPALFSCSVWMKLDKDALEYFDEHVDVEEDFTEDGATDIPWDGPCPDGTGCSGHDDCNDGLRCTMDYCVVECNACVNEPINGAIPSRDDLTLHDTEEYNDSTPRIAWSESEWGVVWSRNLGTDNGEIYFTTVSEDGSSHVYPSIRITDDSQNDVRPRIAWTGSRWAVAWIHYPGEGGRVYLTLITPGTHVWTEFATIHETGEHIGAVDIVRSEGNLGVAFDSQISGNYAMMFTLLQLDGTPTGTETTIDLQPDSMLAPSLAWADSEFGLAWQDQRGGEEDWDIFFVRIDDSGGMIGRPAAVVDTPDLSVFPSLAWSGAGFGVAFHQHTASGHPEIYFQRITPTGSPDGTPELLTTQDETIDESPSLVFSASEYALIYNSNTSLNLIRMASDASPISENTGLNTDGNPVHGAPAIAWNGTRYAVAWEGDAGVWFNLLEICED